MTDINVLDIETYKNKNYVIPYCICIIFLNNEYVFYNNNNLLIDVLNTIVNKVNKKKILFYTHNLNFDGIIIIGELTKNLIKFDIVSEKTNIYCIKIYYCGLEIDIRCSYKIIPLSLKSLGLIEKFEKTVFPYKFVNSQNLWYVGEIPDKSFWENDDLDVYMRNNPTCNKYNLQNETIKYCLNDVRLLQKVLFNLFNIIDEESKRVRLSSLSIPSISHKIFYLKYNSCNIEEELSSEADNFIRTSYFGGRCEVFGNPKTNEIVKYYDFSGMYGQCMLEKFHSGVYYYDNPSKIEKPGFYNITYDSNFNYLPILPSHKDNKLMFLNGLNNGTFWYEEILLFEEMGGKVIKINNAITYKKNEYVFNEYVSKFTKIRERGGYYKIFGKFMINSLYGSLALRDKDTIQFITFSESEFLKIHENTNVLTFYKINDCYVIIIQNDYKAIHLKDKQKIKKRNVSYASAISSKARIKLFKAMNEVILDGGRLLYCDTDSIFAAYPKNDKRKETNTFIWLEFYDDAVFIAPKTYALKSENEEIIKIKGVNEKNISFIEFKNKFYDETVDLSFANQLNFRKSDFILKQYYVTKKIGLNSYNKRIFSKDKTDTHPIKI